jgi:hypothetical protein
VKRAREKEKEKKIISTLSKKKKKKKMQEKFGFCSAPRRAVLASNGCAKWTSHASGASLPQSARAASAAGSGLKAVESDAVCSGGAEARCTVRLTCVAVQLGLAQRTCNNSVGSRTRNTAYGGVESEVRPVGEGQKGKTKESIFTVGFEFQDQKKKRPPNSPCT